MSRKSQQRFLSLLVVFAFLFSFAPYQSPPAGSTAAAAAPTVVATNWCAAGGFNGWNNNQDHLYDDATHGDLVSGDGIFTADLTIATPGRTEFKIVECGNWGNTFPTANSWMFTSTANQVVKVAFDTNNHASDAGTVFLPAQKAISAWDDAPAAGYTVVGSFQGFTNNDPAWLMQDLGRGLFYLAKTIPAAGDYIGKITRTGSWDAFGADGRSSDAQNVTFTTTAADQLVIFMLDARTGRVAFKVNGSTTATWCIAGAFNGWNNSSTPLFDDGTHGDLLGGDGVFSVDFTIPTAGRNEWKAVKCGDWGVTFPAQNSWVVTTTTNQVVKFTLDTNNHAADAGLKLLPAQNIVNAWGDTLPTSFTAVGDFQGWNNSNPATLMVNAGMGYQTLQYAFASPGKYIGKITTTGAWDAFGADGRSADAANVNINVAYAGDVVQFFLDSFHRAPGDCGPAQGLPQPR